MSTKICPKCNIEKDLATCFSLKKDKNGKYYARWVCKECLKPFTKAAKKRMEAKGNLSMRFQRVKSRCKARGIEFTLSKEQWKELIVKPCYYCGKDLSSIKKGSALDRMDNNIGYLPDNVVPCCESCNYIKGDQLTVEEMKAAMEAVMKIRKKN